MNTRRLIGLIVLALLASWTGLRGCTREEPAPAPEPVRAREAFHATKPLHLIVSSQPDSQGQEADVAWLERELRYLLKRGRMHVAPMYDDGSAPNPADGAPEKPPTQSSHAATAPRTYALRVEVAADRKHAELQLIAPDDAVERTRSVEIGASGRLHMVGAVAQVLPQFLDASHVSKDWMAFIGTQDEYAFESYARSASDLFGPAGHGFTRPTVSRPRARTVERLEALTRAHPRFARAWAALAAGYLSLGGDDLASLSELAESSAERALTLDEEVAVAHGALGLVHLRRHDWIAAQGKLESALSLDANLALALEGLACLYADAGHYRAALPHARHAVALQPRNAGANECLTYALTAAPEQLDLASNDVVSVTAVARVRALTAFLAGERSSAERLLRRAVSRAEFDIWADPVLRAAKNPRLIPEALKAITRAANDGYIDSSTEILCGTALKQPEFVFNRLARLQRENAHAPLRLLWLRDAAFLRKHERFEETIGKAGLPSFWHGSGRPDVCAQEPKVYGCNIQEVSSMQSVRSAIE